MKATDRSRRVRPVPAGLLIVLIAAGCAAPGPEAPAPRPAAFGAMVDSIVRTPPVDRTHWGIAVYDPEADRELYALNADLHFVPASNTKLVVTAVALGELGPDWRYRTPLYAVLGPGSDTIAEAVVVIGRGDPTMSDRFHDADFAVAAALADSVAAAGIRRVDGPVTIDASYFENLWFHSAWNYGDRPWSYAAPVAAAGIAEGAVGFVVVPGDVAGEPATLVVLAPEGAMVLVDSVVTDTAGARANLDFRRGFDSDTVFVTGTVSLDQEPDTSWIAVRDPARYLGLALAEALAGRGVGVDGVVVVTDSLEARARLDVRPRPDCGAMPCAPFERCRVERRRGPPPPEGTAAPADTICITLDDPRATDVWPDTIMLDNERRAVRVATWSSPPLADIVAGVLKPSQNWIAETLLKTLGARLEGEGSWDAGVRAEYHYLFGPAGIDSTAIYLRDGSGLTAHNLVTPRAVTQLLAHALKQPWGATYRRALAEPGQEGTLERRLEGLVDRVAAKTGTIRHVNALSGYLIASDGRTLIFSVLTNGSGIGSSDVRAAIDRIVDAMTSIGSRP